MLGVVLTDGPTCGSAVGCEVVSRITSGVGNVILEVDSDVTTGDVTSAVVRDVTVGNFDDSVVGPLRLP